MGEIAAMCVAERLAGVIHAPVQSRRRLETIRGRGEVPMQACSLCRLALAGWRLLAAARRQGPGVALWPLSGPLPGLLDGSSRIVVVETYPRGYYRHFRPPGTRRSRWSKRRREDRLTWIPGLLRWAESLDVTWDAGILHRVEEGFSAGRTVRMSSTR